MLLLFLNKFYLKNQVIFWSCIVIMQIVFTNNVYVSFSYISDSFDVLTFKHNFVSRRPWHH